MIKKYPPAKVAWAIWGLGAALYLIGFFHRVAPAVMVGELMEEFSITAASLGNLSAFYFYSYVAMQIPTGLLADGLGPRKLLTFGALAASVGAVVFGLAPTLGLALLGRFLIGASVAVAFVGMMKIASRWFSERQYATAIGVSLLVGVTGAIVAGVPLRIFIQAFGWRPVTVIAGGLSLVLAALIWLFVADDPSERGYKSYTPPLDERIGARVSIPESLRIVSSSLNTWLILVVLGGLSGPMMAFGGLWGVPYCVARFGISQEQAAAMTSASLFATGLGSTFLGYLSDKLGRRKLPLVTGTIVCTAAWSSALLLDSLSAMAFTGLIVVAGFASGVVVIGFAFAKESVPARFTGTVGGVINMGAMGGPMLLQPAIGVMLDRHWAGAMQGSVRVYDLASYDTALMLMIVWLGAACIATVPTIEKTADRPSEP